MSSPNVIVVTLRDGTEARGEHVGTAEGYVYLASGEHIDRIEQRLIVRYANEEAL